MLTKQYWSYKNPYDKIVFDHSQYIYPEDFKCVYSKNDSLNPVFFVKAFEKTQ